MKKLLFFSFLVILTSCGTGKKAGTNKVNLSRTMFVLGDLTGTDTCEVVTGCDCCASTLILVNKKDFVTESPCVPDVTYTKGTYEIKGNLLICQETQLIEQKVVVNEEGTENQSETTKAISSTFQLEISECEGRLFLKSTSGNQGGVKEKSVVAILKKLEELGIL